MQRPTTSWTFNTGPAPEDPAQQRIDAVCALVQSDLKNAGIEDPDVIAGVLSGLKF